MKTKESNITFTKQQVEYLNGLLAYYGVGVLPERLPLKTNKFEEGDVLTNDIIIIHILASTDRGYILSDNSEMKDVFSDKFYTDEDLLNFKKVKPKIKVILGDMIVDMAAKLGVSVDQIEVVNK